MMNSIFHCIVSFLSLCLLGTALWLCHDEASYFCGDSLEQKDKSYSNVGKSLDNCKQYWDLDKFKKNLPAK